MLCDGKMQCLECPLNATCPSSTRVFVNYCGSMPLSLKEQIYRARTDCRVRRRHLKYNGIQGEITPVARPALVMTSVEEMAHSSLA
jgi:hypothetical protein